MSATSLISEERNYINIRSALARNESEILISAQKTDRCQFSCDQLGVGLFFRRKIIRNTFNCH